MSAFLIMVGIITFFTFYYALLIGNARLIVTSLTISGIILTTGASLTNYQIQIFFVFLGFSYLYVSLLTILICGIKTDIWNEKKM